MPKRRMHTILCLALALIFLYPLAFLPQGAGGEPKYSSVSWAPDDPMISDEFNVSIVVSEPPNEAQISYCGPGEGGSCSIPEYMTPGSNSTTFYKFYPKMTFKVGFYIIHIDLTYPGEPIPLHYEFNVTFKPSPTDISLRDLNPAADQTIVVLPEEEFIVSGKVLNDLGWKIQNAHVNLSIQDTDIFDNTTTDSEGGFSARISIADSGSYSVHLNVTDPIWNMYAEAFWQLTVSDWPLPAVSLTADLSCDPSSVPPGSDINVFYTGSELFLNYSFFNSGTGSALDLTPHLNVSNVNHDLLSANLSEGDYLNGSKSLPTEIAGEYFLILNCTFGQIAPEELKEDAPSTLMTYSVVDRPTWEAHRVLVEMFTQGSCVPCVNVEVAVEAYHEAESGLFDFIMYVLDDDASSEMAAERGVTSTPHVFIDGNFATMVGGGEIEDVVSSLNTTVWNASKRIAPPLGIVLTKEGINHTATITLSEKFGASLTGRLVVYSIETYSNLRNNQGVPIRNRFVGRSADSNIITIAQGGSFVLENVGLIPTATDLLAIFYDEDGNVMQVKRTNMEKDPVIYLKKDTPVVTIEGAGNSSFDLTLEAFYDIQEAPDSIDIRIAVRSVPADISVKDTEGSVLTELPKIYDIESPSLHEVLPCGRTRHHLNLSFDILSSNDTEMIDSFQIVVYSGKKSFTNSVALVRTKSEPLPQVRIESFSLVSEGDSIYFMAKVVNLPPGARLVGTVRPSTSSGSSGQTGAPVTVTLAAIGPTDFKAPVTGIDLNSFDHLTYSLRVESGSSVINQTEERTVRIADIIKIDQNEGDPDDPTFLVGVAVCAAIITLVLIVVLFFILRGKPQVVMDEETIEGPEPIGPEEIATDPPSGDISPEMDTIERGAPIPEAQISSDLPSPPLEQVQEKPTDQISSM